MTYSTSDKKIATVDKNGKVKGIKKGTAIIIVTTKDGKKKAACEVTVKKSYLLQFRNSLLEGRFTHGKT